MNHYPHHIGDFDKATRHLTRIERSVYRDLIELYYDTEAMLSLDVTWLCRKIIARTNEESTAVQQVLNEFFTETPTGWFHDRCEAELDLYRANNSQKSQAGKASAAARAAKRQQAINGSSTGVASDVATGVGASVQQTSDGTPTNQEPRTKNQEPNKKGGKPPLDKSGFDEFWNAWPKNERKQDKAKCKAHWETKGLGSVLAVVLADINVKLGTEKWQGGFIEAPLVYLHNSRWEDGVTANGPGGATLPVPWQDSAAGVDAKAAELGLAPCGPTENRPNFKIRVMAAVLNPPKPLSLDALNALLKNREAA